MHQLVKLQRFIANLLFWRYINIISCTDSETSSFVFKSVAKVIFLQVADYSQVKMPMVLLNDGHSTHWTVGITLLLHCKLVITIINKLSFELRINKQCQF